MRAIFGGWGLGLVSQKKNRQPRRVLWTSKGTLVPFCFRNKGTGEGEKSDNCNAWAAHQETP